MEGGIGSLALKEIRDDHEQRALFPQHQIVVAKSSGQAVRTYK